MRNEEYNAPHLVEIAVAHYQFEMSHPFLDGNGRLGRLVIALYFASFGLLHKPAFYLSFIPLSRYKKLVTDLLETQKSTASTLVKDFVKRGVLRELTGKLRNRLFVFNNYVMVFRKER